MSSSSTRVLLIEDNPSDARLIQEALSEPGEECFDMEVATTLAAGIERLGAGGIDAMLLDLALPDSFGLETFARARAHALGVAIIVLTGLKDDTLALKLVQKGAQDFVAKIDVTGDNLTRAIRYAVEREKLEYEFQKLNEQLETRIKERTAELETANSDLEAFSSSVSHDLRAPLINIHGFSTLLLERYAPKLDDAGLRYLNHIKQGALRMSALINDLLMLARVSRQGLQFREVDLSTLMKEVAKEFETETENRQIEWRVGPLPHVMCDSGLLRQVLVNLCSNAIKYSRRQERTTIEIGRETIGAEEAFFVRDNGVGFSMAKAAKLFMPFQRLHSDEDFEGTGIGLATVARIVQKHGGRIWAKSEENAGATFYFTLDSEACKVASASLEHAAKA
jgi:two-component system, sensor histidine kinase and response regulator